MYNIKKLKRMEILFWITLYIAVVAANVVMNRYLMKYPKFYHTFDCDDTFIIYIPILNIVTLCILIVRYYQLKNDKL